MLARKRAMSDGMQLGANWRGWPDVAKIALLERLREMPGAGAGKYGRYQQDPVGFIEKVLLCGLTTEQRRVAESVRDYPVTVVQSANAVGKTYVAARIALWFLRAYRDSKVISTAAPPLENLQLLLWGEIGAMLTQHVGDAFAEAQMGSLRVALGPEWWLHGRAIPASGTAAEREAKFSGAHAPYLLFIVDEGDAVPDEVYRGIDSCMSGGLARLLIMFNPRSAVGPVYRMIRRSQANVIALDAFSHPNVVEGDEVIPGAVTREVTVKRIDAWSYPASAEESAELDAERLRAGGEWFRVPDFLDGATAQREDGTETPPLVGGQWRRIEMPQLSYMVLAQFPGQAENQLISREWVEAAQERWRSWQGLHGQSPPPNVRPLHGQDVAEFGVDANVACFRYGGYVAQFLTWRGLDVLETADKAAKEAQARNARISFVDATGLGAGVTPGMRRYWQKHQYDGQARAIMVASAPTFKADEGEFALLRDQLWWLCREWLRTDPTAMLPPDDGLADELCSPTYQVRGGKIRVTPKDVLKKLLGRSPDKADALCLTFAPERPVRVARSYQG